MDGPTALIWRRREDLAKLKIQESSLPRDDQQQRPHQETDDPLYADRRDFYKSGDQGAPMPFREGVHLTVSPGEKRWTTRKS
jgi:hypothetical protein